MLPVQLRAAGCLLPQSATAQSYVLGPSQPPQPRPLELQNPLSPSQALNQHLLGPGHHLCLIRPVRGKILQTLTPAGSDCSLDPLCHSPPGLVGPLALAAYPLFPDAPPQKCLFSPPPSLAYPS